MMISISVVRSPCFSSLRRIANSLHYQLSKTGIIQLFPNTAQITCFMKPLMDGWMDGNLYLTTICFKANTCLRGRVYV